MRGDAQWRWTIAARCAAALVFACAGSEAAAQSSLDPAARPGLRWPAGSEVLLAQSDSPAEPTQGEQSGVTSKSYAIPALEILLFDVLVNRVNNATSGSSDYHVTMESVRRNLREGWVTDNDPFSVNQFAHPYQGAVYHGLARSTGLGYWEASAYTFLGSAAWEVFGERTRPAVNDQIASGIAGSFLGEALFRMASLVLEDGGNTPGFWRELFAAGISPPVGFNRLLFGEHFGRAFASRGASYYGRLQLGASTTVHPQHGLSSDLKRTEGLLDFSLVYGLPGKEGYTYKRPFDYFLFDATATTANTIENISTRGLLVGTGYGGGTDRYRGLWGLFGSYDYIAPQAYRISTTALSLGTRVQWWLNPTIALQGSALLGIGYAAVGALSSRSENDYTYGAAPQGAVSARLIFSERVALEASGREFFVSGVGRGTDNIARGDVAATVRVTGHHALALRYLWNRRDANSGALGSRTQIRSTIGLYYAYLGREDFGVVDWR